MSYGTMEAYEFVCRLDQIGKVADSPDDRKQKAATTLLRDEIQKQDFAKPVATGVSRVFGPVSRFRFAQILPHMCHACAAQRLHIEGEEQRCRAGCPDESDSLSHYNECPLLYNFFASVWRHAAILPRRGHLFHDLVTQIFLRSRHYGIVVMGVIDAFVYADNHHPKYFQECMKGRIRFMTAITPAYAHAYQVTCLTRHMPAVQSQKFRLPSAKARYPHLPNSGTATRERGNEFQG